jgi:hypothetical protein
MFAKCGLKEGVRASEPRSGIWSGGPAEAMPVGAEAPPGAEAMPIGAEAPPGAEAIGRLPANV